MNNRDINYFECLEELKKSFRDTYEYFDVVDYVWWESFLNEQSDIIKCSMNEDIFLKNPFTWPQRTTNEKYERNAHEQHERQVVFGSSLKEER